MVDDANRPEHLVAEHRAQLLLGVAAMRPRGDEQHDVIEAHEPVQLLEDGRDDDLPRLGPSAVADADRDRAAAAGDVAQWPAGNGPAQRLEHRGPRVRGGRGVQRFDHGRALVRELDRETVAAVRERDLHDGRASSSGGS